MHSCQVRDCEAPSIYGLDFDLDGLEVVVYLCYEHERAVFGGDSAYVEEVPRLTLVEGGEEAS